MRRIAAVAGLAVLALAFISAAPPQKKFLWNRTESAPEGLYIIKRTAPDIGAWAAVSGDAPSTKWIAGNGYLARGWPVIKRVAATEGDEICRDGDQVFINGIHAATALKADGAGRELPLWQGCLSLQANELFLMNDHPRSLDGRYFGATNMDDVIGVAVAVWVREPAR